MSNKQSEEQVQKTERVHRLSIQSSMLDLMKFQPEAQVKPESPLKEER